MSHSREPSEQDSLSRIFSAALAAVDPYNVVLKAVKVEGDQLQLAGTTYDLASFSRIIVIGAGKATARMALAVESLLGRRITAGLIVVKHGHTAPLSIIQQVEAAHPVPDEAGCMGTQRMLQLLPHDDESTLVICLLSGGASALMVAPADGITLQDKQAATRLLLNAGASINELNAVRKHLSQVKGGRLAQTIFPAQLLTLIVSDVIGDSLDVIASGPTATDDSTFADACAVIERYGLVNELPPSVMKHLQRGCTGQLSETVKQNAPCWSTTQNCIIACNTQALAGAAGCATRLGYEVKHISATLQGEAREAARSLAEIARTELAGMQSGERRCLLCGGETTVTVRGHGKGGRNQEFALAFALEIDGITGISLLSAGTDGSDGMTDAAGAMVDANTVTRAREFELEPFDYLTDNDSWTFFQSLDAVSNSHCHFKTGATGTNVMDMQIVLLHKL